MIEISRERRVAAEPAAVWAVVATPERAPGWFAFADRVAVLDGAGHCGTRSGHARVRGPRDRRQTGPVARPACRALPGKLTKFNYRYLCRQQLADTDQLAEGVEVGRFSKDQIRREDPVDFGLHEAL